jgi:endogenous inhibitor of DNA gyrase (YacG/DUF329 family)
VTERSTCPTCRTKTAREGNATWPFCCERCRLVDLGRWLNEEYRIPAEDAELPTDDGDGDQRDATAAPADRRSRTSRA